MSVQHPEREGASSTQSPDTIRELDAAETTEMHPAVGAGESSFSASKVVAGTAEERDSSGSSDQDAKVESSTPVDEKCSAPSSEVAMTAEECDDPGSSDQDRKAESSSPMDEKRSTRVSSEPAMTAEASAASVSGYSGTTAEESNVPEDEKGAFPTLKDMAKSVIDRATKLQESAVPVTEESAACAVRAVDTNLEGSAVTDPGIDSSDSSSRLVSSTSVPSSNAPEVVASHPALPTYAEAVQTAQVESTAYDTPASQSDVTLYQRAGPSNENVESYGGRAVHGWVGTGTPLYRSRSDSEINVFRREATERGLTRVANNRSGGDFPISLESNAASYEEAVSRMPRRQERPRQNLLQENPCLGCSAIAGGMGLQIMAAGLYYARYKDHLKVDFSLIIILFVIGCSLYAIACQKS